MDFSIEHEVPGRVRVRLVGQVPDEDLDAFSTVIEEIPCVEKAVVYPRIGSVAVSYRQVDGRGVQCWSPFPALMLAQLMMPVRVASFRLHRARMR